MLDLFGYSAYITVDGVPLPEFQTDINETSRTATCWIPSEAGKKFAIQLESSRPECKTSTHVYVDGSIVRKSPLDAAKPPVGNSKKKVDFVRVVENGTEMQRPFCFSTITPTNDERYLHREVPPGLGEISITTKRILSNARPTTPPSKVSKLVRPTSHEILHEKFKKISAHCVSFGDPRPSEPARYYKIPPYDRTDPKPFATFIFKYRSADVLQANEIMPRPQKRKRREDAYHAGGSDSDEETRSQIRKLRVKLENMERKVSRRKTSKMGSGAFANGEIIDLTQEDIPVFKTELSRSTSFDEGEVIDLT